MAWLPGTRVGSYEIVSALGDGGMGAVFRVRHLISERMEAMKVLLAASSANQEMLDRFTREIRVLATLNHPNIAALHTAFHHEGQLVMVMECVEGMDLRRTLMAGITLDQAVAYTRQVLTALEYAHSREVIHRDIKPSNIMVTPEGRVKVLDFGLALALPDARLTTTGALVGSMHYIAPELISGEAHDARSDLYALGVTLYEMITGKLPIEGTNYAQVIGGLLRHNPISPSQVNKMIPAGGFVRGDEGAGEGKAGKVADGQRISEGAGCVATGSGFAASRSYDGAFGSHSNRRGRGCSCGGVEV